MNERPENSDMSKSGAKGLLNRIANDRREIASLSFKGTIDVQNTEITRIEAYEEPGQGAMVPWFAVYVGDEIRWRIPAHMVTVEYAE